MWAHGEKSGHGEHCGPMERRVDMVSIVGPMERRVDTVSIVGHGEKGHGEHCGPWREEWTR